MNGTYRSVLISEITWCRSQLNSPEKLPDLLFSRQKQLAVILYKEKQHRLKMKAMEKMGRPFIEAITSPLRMFGTE
ncbi:hypothetical protein P8452_73363 [Trifolium repens]|nr:hypothetical protein P8452_73363 [Trifolium repens]